MEVASQARVRGTDCLGVTNAEVTVQFKGQLIGLISFARPLVQAWKRFAPQGPCGWVEPRLPLPQHRPRSKPPGRRITEQPF